MKVLEERQMLVGLLEKGMYVSRLDRDWVGTPFSFQGFEITSSEDIELLSAYCTSVFIDVQKSVTAQRPSLRVEPAGDWGEGSVRLIEIPSRLEADDNIVAFWVPAGMASGTSRTSTSISSGS